MRKTVSQCLTTVLVWLKSRIISNRLQVVFPYNLKCFPLGSIDPCILSQSTCGRSLAIPFDPQPPIAPQEVMKDPVMLLESGHTYERTHIEDWIRHSM